MTTLADWHFGASQSDGALAAESACRELLHAFAHLVDSGAATQVVDLFTEDAELVSPQRTLTGHTQLRDVMIQREDDTERMTRHQVTNVLFRRYEPNSAQSSSLLFLYVLGGPTELNVRAITVFDDEFRRDHDGRWRFSRRQATPVAGGR
jgi:ketosteroid isomerase-like protein